jgi:hypothetical protein
MRSLSKMLASIPSFINLLVMNSLELMYDARLPAVCFHPKPIARTAWTVFIFGNDEYEWTKPLVTCITPRRIGH